MLVVLSHTTAFLYWRTFTRRRNRLKPVAPASGMTERLAWTPQLASELAQLGIVPTEYRPLHVLFAKAGLRPVPNAGTLPPLRPHVQTAELPAGSILRLSEHVAIVSPELCFLQMAARFSVERLILAGFELCGTYALLPDPENPARDKVVERPALTCSADIANILTHPMAARNRRAQAAAAHLMDGAASPMEAKVALLLTLPSAMGGYALPRPVLNPELPLGRNAQTLYPHSTVRPDLFWADARFDVEYDGSDHDGEESRAKDAGRRAALEAEGVTVLTLTYPQVAGDAAFDILARRIAKTVGAPVRIRIKGDGHATRRTRLRAELEL